MFSRWRAIVFCMVLLQVGCGKKHDEIVAFEVGDPEIVAAMEEARRTVDTFLEHVKSPSRDEMLGVKLPIGPGNAEHIWAESVRFENGKIYGRLSNRPASEGYQLGDEVSVAPSEISDWVIMRPDQSFDGGYTLRVMMKKTGRSQP